MAEALEWARDRGLSVDDDLSYLREFEHITLARVLLAQCESERVAGGVHDALGLLERLLHAAEDGGRTGSAIEILALQALAHQALGDTSLALAPLERALSLAEPRVTSGSSWTRGRRWPAFCRKPLPPGRAGEREAVVGSLPRPGRAVSSPPTTRTRASARSKCSGIAAGLTNQEIAARLYLSLYTVKAHARSIYDKLDAHSRTQAVATARELGILPAP